MKQIKGYVRDEMTYGHEGVLQKLAERGTLSSASSSLSEAFASLEISMLNLRRHLT